MIDHMRVVDKLNRMKMNTNTIGAGARSSHLSSLKIQGLRHDAGAIVQDNVTGEGVRVVAGQRAFVEIPAPKKEGG
jgi:hypothetical protein